MLPELDIISLVYGPNNAAFIIMITLCMFTIFFIITKLVFLFGREIQFWEFTFIYVHVQECAFLLD
jgi:TM2 domain-containing membrane protein YozV